MNVDGRPIGVFDSGIGGLSVLQELYALLPKENYIFFADQHNVPYGEKTKEELIALTTWIMEFLLEHDVKFAVVACNTATCYAIDTLRNTFDVPIVGVVPAIKPAAERTKTGNIGLIATPATAKSGYVAGLVEQFAPGKNVIKVGCPGLENAVEAGDLDSEETLALLKKYLLPLKDENIDELVLGCTHYPFLRRQIGEVLGPGVELLDSGNAVARRVRVLLTEKGLLNDGGTSATRFFTSGDAAHFSKVASSLLGIPVEGHYAPFQKR